MQSAVAINKNCKRIKAHRWSTDGLNKHLVQAVSRRSASIEIRPDTALYRSYGALKPPPQRVFGPERYVMPGRA